MKIILFTIMTTAALLGSAAPSLAQQAGGTACATPGTAILANIPPSKDDLVPSVSSEITGYGRQAKANNCLIDLICVATDSSGAARDIATKQCVVLRDRLVKSGFAKGNIDISRKSPGSGRVAGTVYFIVH